MADMPLNIADQIAIAVSLAEGQFREFKSSLSGPPGAKTNRPVRDICKDIGEALVAFANADGGELIVGVEDDGHITGNSGFSEQDMAKLRDAPRTHVHPDTPLQSVLVRSATIMDKSVLYFRTNKGTTHIHLTADGRCLKRNDLQSTPVPPQQIMFGRNEVRSREYDREFVDGANVSDLEDELIKIVADQISHGISVDKCLQYLGLAEYDGVLGLRLRRAALLLFARSPDQWHPRLQVRIIKVNGKELGAGAEYNVSSDNTVKKNIFRLIDESWDNLRINLVHTKFDGDARFRATYIYPEVACREALVNAIAHRDYSDEGAGIEIFVYDDRIEIRNPGALLSTITVNEIKLLKGVHQSRNSYVSRALREAGIMRELGEGMKRIFELMRNNELAAPDIITSSGAFSLILHHRPMYSRDESIWLEQYDAMNLNKEEKAVLLIGRRGDLVAPNDIIRRVGIVDIENYRQIVDSLQKKGILVGAVSKLKAKNEAQKKGIALRDVPRFRVVSAKEAKPLQVRPRKIHTDSKPLTQSGKPMSYKSRQMVSDQEVFVGNIPPNTNERDLIQLFMQFGDVVSVAIPTLNGRNRGYAFVGFENAAMAGSAISGAVEMGSRALVVRARLPRKPRTRREYENGPNQGRGD